MMTKILFTLVVIVVVGMLFAKSNGEAVRAASKASKAADADASVAPRTLAYGLIALLIVVSALIYYFSWSSANQLVTLRLVGLGGEVSEYQAYRKDIKDRSFTTVSGKTIRMADSDRMELLD